MTELWTECDCGETFLDDAAEPFSCTKCNGPLCDACEAWAASGLYAHRTCLDAERAAIRAQVVELGPFQEALCQMPLASRAELVRELATRGQP